MNTPARPTSGVYDLQSPSYHHEVAGSASGVSARSSAALSVRQATSQAEPKAISSPSTLHVALLTGGSDKPYALGMATALSSAGVSVDFIGSDELDLAELHKLPKLRFLNLRGDQSQEASFRRKIARVARYYWRLIGYAATADGSFLRRTT